MPPAPVERPPARLDSLTALRFVAAFLVFCLHASLGVPPLPEGVQPLLAKAGWAGVSCFFILSGFVLAHAARPDDTPRRFWRRRLAKIYPNHALTAAAAFALLTTAHLTPTLAELLPNLLLLHAWVPDPAVFVSGNPVSWSLSAELFFYALFPALWHVLARVRPRHLWTCALLLTGTITALPAAVHLLVPPGPPLPMPDGTPGLWHYWAVYVLPPARLPEFALGMVLARIVRTGRWRGPGPRTAALLAAGACVLATHAPYLYGLTAVTTVPLAALICALATTDRTDRTDRTGAPARRCRALARRAMVRLGELSFAFYLVHRPVLTHGDRLLAAAGIHATTGMFTAALRTLAFLAVSLLLARLLHDGVERPLTRRLGRPRPPRDLPNSPKSPGDPCPRLHGESTMNVPCDPPSTPGPRDSHPARSPARPRPPRPAPASRPAPGPGTEPTFHKASPSGDSWERTMLGRLAIDDISPVVGHGAHRAKAVVGEHLDIAATVWREGHEAIGADVIWYDPDGTRTRIRMRPDAENPDRHHATAVPTTPGHCHYRVQAWADPWTTWRTGLQAKLAAGIDDLANELESGARLLDRVAASRTAASPAASRTAASRTTAEAALSGAADRDVPPSRTGAEHNLFRRTSANRSSADRSTAEATLTGAEHNLLTRAGTAPAPPPRPATTAETAPLGADAGTEAALLTRAAAELRDTTLTPPDRARTALSPQVHETVMAAPPRDLVTESRACAVQVERPRAQFGSWYELFPRSTGGTHPDGTPRHGTLRTAAEELPRIARMGFDVVYLPPIHPIGRTHRKGRNNTLTAGPDDVGSPWAIGSADGGHDAIHPELGTVEDFAHFVDRARGHGLEVALDLALQCSPDHPWLTEHPEWFTARPDGTVAHAENPPKKYEDIHPLDFDRAPETLYPEVLRIVRLWIDRGVRIFRVDNPHTKPPDFWDWLIRTVQDTHPDVVFLAEAFTRPAVLEGLARRGFSQSYTYFTWRDTKQELTTYLTELVAAADHLRPNFFVNTPDILPVHLQRGGPGMFALRAALAATLSPSWGVYSGYELYENEPLRPGTEEYLHSEKYELRPRDHAAARAADRSLEPWITRLNQIRRDHPALHQLRTLRFHPVDNDALIAYSKSDPATGDTVLCVVNLNPTGTEEGNLALDLDGLDAVTAVDALTGDVAPLRPVTAVKLSPERSAARIFAWRTP
ncbi:maltotransferase domain-containing protein [Actinomycetota bacterium Odt1-20B]